MFCLMLFPEETGTCITGCQPQLPYYPRHLMQRLQKWLGCEKPKLLLICFISSKNET